jgi:methylase of polypeptide subunit release factors
VVNRAVDICSGAGPGAVAIARQRPGVEVLMADINANALEASRINAELAQLPNLRPVNSDLLSNADGDFDLIVANPPYLNDKAQRTYRHGGGSHGAALSLAILNAALPRLRSEGKLVLYTGVAILQGDDPFYGAAAKQLAEWKGSWCYREIDPDVFGEELDEPTYADADRIAAVLLTVTKS